VAEQKKEQWTQWVALTTTILAVCAAISSLKGGGYSTRVQLATTMEVNKWSYFQAKGLKQNLREQEAVLLEVAALEARTPEGRKLAQDQREVALAEVKRYEAEKGAIKAEAEKLKEDEDLNKRHGGAFGQAVMLLQIAITMSAVGALIKKPVMWWLGLAFGAAGLVYMANGYLLFF
jgi:hypothetical protein